MIMRSTSPDKIERSVVIQEAIHQFRRLGNQLSLPLKYGSVPLAKASAAPKACRLRLLKGKNECQSTRWTVALISRPTQVSEFGPEETSLAFVGSAATSCPDPNPARDLTRI